MPSSLPLGFQLYTPKSGSHFTIAVSVGDEVKDLLRRWETDCLALAPNWISILIGVNDMWRRYDSNNPPTTGQFESNYRRLLDQTYSRLNPQVILCEPFLLPLNDQQKTWRDDLDPKIEVVQRLAREYNAILVPLDTVFAEAAQQREPDYWLPDGVHTSPAGAGTHCPIVAQSREGYLSNLPLSLNIHVISFIRQ